ncbi:LacI family DNA-binding transcriptional regulator [Ruficoccus amylovorans]|uniref:LacI family DNA-binding transcriptional regulator n=1 Tax=Ruficoccus amylovorans TaxID=1804625 RepID=A0A842HFK3_9BACT|nr:LacI family DNA-binding transcriptional regulator [Ruficoccus amylovorans]
MSAKIEDIAKEAGVSRATVSRVINGSDAVKAKTAEHVMKVMSQLGYSTTARRPGPRPKNIHPTRLRMGAVALITIGGTGELLQEPTMAMVVEHIRAECRKRQLNLLLDQVTGLGQIPLCVQTQQIDGAILMLSARIDYQREVIAELAALVPCVHLFSPGHPVATVDHASVNDVAIGALAFQELRQSNCASYVTISANHDMHEALLVRGRAFLDRVQNSSLPGHSLALKMSKGQSSRVWPQPTTELASLADLPEVLEKLHKQLPGPVGYFLTLENAAPRVHEALERQRLISDGHAKLVVAGTTPYFVRDLKPAPVLIDLCFPDLVRVALDRLVQRVLHFPEDRVTLLLSPMIAKN